ncbi:MAG TPA: hypothetical protein VH079_11215 [Terriglobales bacterium]|nr:hypothetical protein [Terriglobales bacterium]
MFRIKPFLISLASISFLFCFSGVSTGQQLWSGIVSAPRAADWTHAGVMGGIPSGSWSQCGATVAAYKGTAATINNAIASCGSKQYVLLGAGTFTLSSGIDFANRSNVVLRGSGANSTFLVFNSGASVNCNDGAALVCINSADSTYWVPNTAYNWTGGYAQGATQVTLSNTSGISNNTIVVLNQCDDGYSGSTCSGSSIDNGNYFNSSDQYSSSGPTGSSYNGPDAGNGTAHRFQTEMFPVTNVSSGTVTLATGLKHPNWNSSRTPQAWFFTPITNAGVENLSIDSSATSSALYGISVFNSMNVWVRGVRVVKANISPVAFFDSSHFTVQDNYFYEAQSTDDFGVHLTVTSDGLVQNNIFQQFTGDVVMEGDDDGTVIGYNYAIGNCNYTSSVCSDALGNAYRPHSNGVDFELYEGNVGTNYDADGDHGTHLSQTLFRNFFTGWESCGASNSMNGNGPCGSTNQKDFLTNSMLLAAFQGRYHNMIGNVLGTPGYHTNYQYTTTLDNHAIFGIGTPVAGGMPPYDGKVLATLFRWGNYDVATNAVRFCGGSSDTGWSSTCGSTSEVPSSLSVFPNAIPTVGDTGAGQPALPASFYLSSKPSWFGSTPWPAIGPEVKGGNVGQCSGNLNASGQFAGVPAISSSQCSGTSLTTAWAGHVNAIPAMSCFLNTMGGTPDGTGNSALSFNANSCYGGTTTPPSNPAPPAPTGLAATVQ